MSSEENKDNKSVRPRRQVIVIIEKEQKIPHHSYGKTHEKYSLKVKHLSKNLQHCPQWENKSIGAQQGRSGRTMSKPTQSRTAERPAWHKHYRRISKVCNCKCIKLR